MAEIIIITAAINFARIIIKTTFMTRSMATAIEIFNIEISAHVFQAVALGAQAVGMGGSTYDLEPKAMGLGA